jgi:hypothetical protein
MEKEDRDGLGHYSRPGTGTCCPHRSPHVYTLVTSMGRDVIRAQGGSPGLNQCGG